LPTLALLHLFKEILNGMAGSPAVSGDQQQDGRPHGIPLELATGLSPLVIQGEYLRKSAA